MTAPYSFDGSKSTLGSRGAVAVPVLAVSLLGVGAGYPLQTLLGVVGGLLFGVAGRDVAADGLRERVRGSALLVVASVLVVGSLVLPTATVADGVLVGAIPIAVGMTMLAAVADVEAVAGSILSTLGRSLVVTVMGTLLAAALYANVFTALAGASWRGFESALAVTPLFGFVALQFEFLVVGLLGTRAGNAAAELDPGSEPPSREGFRIRDVPNAVWLLLAAQVVVLSFPGGPGLFEFVLSLAGPVGAFAAFVLSSPLLHGAVLSLAVILGILPTAVLVRNAAIAVLGSQAPKSLALASGATAFATAVVVVTSLPYVPLVITWLVRGNTVATKTIGTHGVGPATLGAVAAVLFTMLVVAFGLFTAMAFPFVPERATGFGYGAAALFVAATAGAFANAPAPAVFVAMAASVVTWELGEYATTLGGEVGATAETRSVEFVHGVGTLGVGALGVALASLATHFLVPAMTTISKPRALTALGLLATAILVFAYLANTAGEPEESGDDRHRRGSH